MRLIPLVAFRHALLVSQQQGTLLCSWDHLLRSAYLVFDIDNNEISIARTNFNPIGSDVLEIGTGKSAVPNATPVANAVVATAGTTSYGLPSPTAANGLGAGNATASGSQKGASTRSFGASIFLGWCLLYVWL